VDDRSVLPGRLDGPAALSHSQLLIGSPDEVTEKILHHSEALGGISRITFQMNAASLPHEKMMGAIEMLAGRVAPLLR
jgi:alkanesulfonate monooxygenase SsuD/methylene tetrahydromethanopterin reductase-like flavin-dependent oxidoreductase (luciferase family)